MTEASPTTRAPRPRQGELLELEIDSLAQGGRGVARTNGYVVFVSGALPGDRVRARLVRSRRDYGEAKAIELLRRGAERIPDRCLHGGEPCPGAPWQGMAYERQLAEKQGQVDDALRRLGRLDGFELEPIEPAVEQWRYRNKLEYSFGPGEGANPPALGYHRRGNWAEIVDVDDCLLASEPNNAARNAVRGLGPPGKHRSLRPARPDRRPSQPRRPRGPPHRRAPNPAGDLRRPSFHAHRSTSTR